MSSIITHAKNNQTTPQVITAWERKAHELRGLCVGVNNNGGTDNCGYVATRVIEHLKYGRNLHAGPVPTGNAGIILNPDIDKKKNGRLQIVRSFTNNEVLLSLCGPRKSPLPISGVGASASEPIDLSDDTKSDIFEIDIDSDQELDTESLNLYKRDTKEIVENLELIKSDNKSIAEQLKKLPRDKNGNISGFIFLTRKHSIKKGHILVFHVFKDKQQNKDLVFFIDAQPKEKEAWVLPTPDLTQFRPEIYFLPVVPKDGYSIKQELGSSEGSAPASSSSAAAMSTAAVPYAVPYTATAAKNSNFVFAVPKPKAPSIVQPMESELVKKLAKKLREDARYDNAKEFLNTFTKMAHSVSPDIFFEIVSKKPGRSSILTHLVAFRHHLDLATSLPRVLWYLKASLKDEHFVQLLTKEQSEEENLLSNLAFNKYECIAPILPILKSTLTYSQFSELVMFQNRNHVTFLLEVARNNPKLIPEILTVLQSCLQRNELRLLVKKANGFNHTFLQELAGYGPMYLEKSILILTNILDPKEILEIFLMESDIDQTLFSHVIQKCPKSLQIFLNTIKDILSTEDVLKLYREVYYSPVIPADSRKILFDFFMPRLPDAEKISLAKRLGVVQPAVIASDSTIVASRANTAAAASSSSIAAAPASSSSSSSESNTLAANATALSSTTLLANPATLQTGFNHFKRKTTDTDSVVPAANAAANAAGNNQNNSDNADNNDNPSPTKRQKVE